MIARIARLLTTRRMSPLAEQLDHDLAIRRAARIARREAAEHALSAEWKRRGDAARAYRERLGL